MLNVYKQHDDIKDRWKSFDQKLLNIRTIELSARVSLKSSTSGTGYVYTTDKTSILHVFSNVRICDIHVNLVIIAPPVVRNWNYGN